MINIKIDGKMYISNYNFIYHYQKIPRPGGHLYSLSINIDHKFFSYLKEKYEYNIGEDLFINKIYKSHHNHYNPIVQMQDYMDFWPKKKEDICWVFNSIDKVELKTSNLIISGVASKFMKEFD